MTFTLRSPWAELMFGLWCLDQYQRDREVTTLIAAVVSFALSLGLAIYDSWFLRKTTAFR